jgi:hypothetical protein
MGWDTSIAQGLATGRNGADYATARVLVKAPGVPENPVQAK